jgi:hypothetical protein
VVAKSAANDYYEVAAWLTNDTNLLQSHGEKPALWSVHADGTNLTRLTDGIYVGIVGAP